MKVLCVLDFMRVMDLCKGLSTPVNEASFRLIKLGSLSWKIVYDSYRPFEGALYNGGLNALKTVRVYHLTSKQFRCSHMYSEGTL